MFKEGLRIEYQGQEEELGYKKKIQVLEQFKTIWPANVVLTHGESGHSINHKKDMHSGDGCIQMRGYTQN